MKVIYPNGEVKIAEGKEELEVLRHSAAHLLAQAVKRLYPNAKMGYGPANENGFYYDIDLGEEKLSEDSLGIIEKEMEKAAEENFPVKPFILSRIEAISLMKERGEDYKAEHISDLPPEAEISFYRQGDYIDMCRGPHVTYTNAVKVFKLTGISGAYWKNDSRNKMLTRIYGTAFLTKDELKRHLEMLKEAEKRDHRRIGKEMELFMLSEEGLGFPFFLPNGMIIKNELISYWREIHEANGYREISTPMMLNRRLWETSGHWEHYKDKMYSSEIDGDTFCIKPMNCPGGVIVYGSRPHSYRELPIRLGELGVVHRNELKGTLHGLFRVRCLTQDDAHIFMREEQVKGEIAGVISLIDSVYKKFGFSYSLELSTRPEDSMGSDEDWEMAERGLREALELCGKEYEVNEGDGAFYGPKIDFHLKDSLDRTWQCGTIQLDFQLPKNFDLSYIDEKGEKRRPIMIHRVCFGSVERFIGILTEHYGGRFPFWLAPIQVKVLTVSNSASDYAEEVYERLRAAGIRCRIDGRNEKLGYMIREAQYKERVPYMVIIGEKEKNEGNVSVRFRDKEGIETFELKKLICELEELKRDRN